MPSGSKPLNNQTKTANSLVDQIQSTITTINTIISTSPYAAYGIIGLAALVSALFPFLYFWEKTDVLFRFWDGPLYMYVAKTFYFIPEDHPFTPYQLPEKYFACHFPLYPLLIRLFATLTFGNYEWGMMLATASSTIAAVFLFYRLLICYKVAHPITLCIFFCVLPPRWLIYNTVGATEPLFFCFLFGAFIAYKKELLTWLIVCIVGAILTRITGVLLIPAFMLLLAFQRQWLKSFYISLSGFALIALFTFYYFVYGDFFSYFSWNLDKQGLVKETPFLLLKSYAPNADYHSAELYVWSFVLYGIGVAALWEKYKPFFVFSLIYYIFCAFIFHNDLSRYLLGIAPFAIILAYEGIWTRRGAIFALPIVLYLIHTYILGFIPHNTVVPFVYEGLLKALAN